MTVHFTLSKSQRPYNEPPDPTRAASSCLRYLFFYLLSPLFPPHQPHRPLCCPSNGPLPSRPRNIVPVLSAGAFFPQMQDILRANSFPSFKFCLSNTFSLRSALSNNVPCLLPCPCSSPPHGESPLPCSSI